MDGDVPRHPSYGVYISQFIRFARVCSHEHDFNARNLCLTAKLLRQGYRCHKLKKAFSMCYCRHHELDLKFNVRLKFVLNQGLSEPNFHGDFKKIFGSTDFSDPFQKVIIRHKRISCNVNVLRQSACLVINRITVHKSNRKAMDRNWSNQKTNPALKTKRELNIYYKYTKYNENKLLTERAAISQKVATQQPKLD